MNEKLLTFFNRGITTSFYLLFLLVPLAFTSLTSELFEFNKMWLTFFLTTLIVTFWLGKMVLGGKVLIQRTPLDIPIGLFLLSQIISTFFSLDTHISFWGYYSRFNGGLLSIITYITLFYAFASNYHENATKYVRIFLWASISSGIVVALWGLPSHFGYDPTCLLFRGTLDVACWTDAFQPKIRIFSTLGQPNWMAIYLAILLPIAMAFLFENSKSEAQNPSRLAGSKFEFLKLFRVSIFDIRIYLSLIIGLFYLDLIFTGSQSGYLGLCAGLLFFFSYSLPNLFKSNRREKLKTFIKTPVGKFLGSILILLLVLTFIFGSPISQINRFTYPALKTSLMSTKPVASEVKQQPQEPKAPAFAGELGGTDSLKIRLIVWKGAFEIWKHNPLFGTGVETFAYAYYKYRPVEHNMTSEWDFLYNKAHNEYLNYLATTGAFGLGSYLSIIGMFLFISFKQLNDKTTEQSKTLPTALIASYLAILVSNFFGFSVVIVNIYFFILPLFTLFLLGSVPSKSHIGFKLATISPTRMSKVQWAYLGIITLLCIYSSMTLYRFWVADTLYALGYNLNRAGQYQTAYEPLHQAVIARPDEPAFQDELTYNDAVLALSFATQKDATTAAALAQEAVQISNQLKVDHPNSITFWKTRIRAFYLFSQIDPQYLPLALEAVEKTATLAPTDAKVSYNLGILYAQNDNLDKAISTLENTIKLKPDYHDAYYALGLFYHESVKDAKGTITKPENEKKARDTMQYILDHFDKNNVQAKQALSTWGN